MASKLKNAKLKGHEKFVVREGWITKGIAAVATNPRIFVDGEGTDLLGVGSNMVKSIRYWLKVFGLIEEHPGAGATLTPLGGIIHDNDLYLEDVFSLWILHSEIVRMKTEATIWNLMFMDCEIDDLNKNEIITIVEKEFNNYVGTTDYSHKSLADDVDTVLKMYTLEDDKDYDPENKNRSPFSELGLVVHKHNKFSKVPPSLNKLSPWVILYELSRLYREQEEQGTQTDTLSIDDMETKSIGRIYNLSRVNINQYLDRLEQLGYIKVVRTAGLDSVYKTDQMLEPEEILERYYEDRI